MGVVLGQQRECNPFFIYYASRTLNSAQINYSTTAKELPAIVFVLDKFCSYFICSPITIITDHSSFKYLHTKKDVKARLKWWIKLLQEFDMIIRRKKNEWRMW